MQWHKGCILHEDLIHCNRNPCTTLLYLYRRAQTQWNYTAADYRKISVAAVASDSCSWWTWVDVDVVFCCDVAHLRRILLWDAFLLKNIQIQISAFTYCSHQTSIWGTNDISVTLFNGCSFFLSLSLCLSFFPYFFLSCSACVHPSFLPSLVSFLFSLCLSFFLSFRPSFLSCLTCVFILPSFLPSFFSACVSIFPSVLPQSLTFRPVQNSTAIFLYHSDQHL